MGLRRKRGEIHQINLWRSTSVLLARGPGKPFTYRGLCQKQQCGWYGGNELDIVHLDGSELDIVHPFSKLNETTGYKPHNPSGLSSAAARSKSRLTLAHPALVCIGEFWSIVTTGDW
ncbi:hypothetical protein Zm00014a_019610 [Zea mays]|uniref:Uncharacterized protein n=2 Tax=Zea mays TaxID=4577 RepID=A0A1D6HA47_MAIZE|nr:hypothetical protein ZEAMMB73_Zm00001d016742 [Zea mays]PWZ23235.1 hypothetical protein Zm00014a_019610 [Zea mays]